MIFKSKGENLSFILNKKLKGIKIPKIYIFNFKDFENNPLKILSDITKYFDNKIAIRSSSSIEDGLKASHAGEFKSFLNLYKDDQKNIKKYIIEVFESYGKPKQKDQQILVQEMVKSIYCSGVILSCDLTNYSESYYVANFTIGNDSTLATSGSGEIKNFTYFKDSKTKNLPKLSKLIIKNMNKLIKVTDYKYLDIEFAIDKSYNFYLLQLRPIVFNKNKELRITNTKNRNKLEKKIYKLQTDHPNLLGNTTYFGVMPDWNPAEMIGLKPKTLSMSLYKELITDKIWSRQRTGYGYKNVLNNQLMCSFLGTPFIDIRTDFNSWIPTKLTNKTSKKLINYYLSEIKLNKKYHDSVEFNILYTCFNFKLKTKINDLKKKNFNQKEINEILNTLKEITNNSIIKHDDELIKIKKLKLLQDKVQKSDMYEVDKIYWLINDCKEYGTLPFAGLARIAFVAYDILESMVESDFISITQKEIFMQNLNTVSKKINDDFNSDKKSEFIKKHGHLRPNSYEITSLNYEEGYNLYYNKTKKNKVKRYKNKKVDLSDNQIKKINKFLKDNNFTLDAKQLFKFIKQAIESREYSKYVFTKSIDLIFKNLTKLGKRLGIKKEELSFLKINDILDLYYNLSSEDIKVKLSQSARINIREYNINSSINLPKIIIKPDDIYYFSDYISDGSYIGSKTIVGDIIYIDNINFLKKIDFNNKIVCINNADPGYDFIFSKNIKGLITCYGGANSHMSIRCSELNMTSIIGIGENNFRKITNNTRIFIDPIINKYSIVK